MIRSKNFILILTLCLGASTACAKMSWLQKMRADHTDAQHNTTKSKRDITWTKFMFYRKISQASLATLAGYGIKAGLNKLQGKPFLFPRKHKAIVAAATGLLAISFKWGMDFQDLFEGYQATLDEEKWGLNKPKDDQQTEVKTEAQRAEEIKAQQAATQEVKRKSALDNLIKEGKGLILEAVKVKEPLIKPQDVNDQNQASIYYGYRLTHDLANFIQRYLELPEVQAELTALRESTKEFFIWEELSAPTQTAVFLLHIIEGSGEKITDYYLRNAHLEEANNNYKDQLLDGLYQLGLPMVKKNIQGIHNKLIGNLNLDEEIALFATENNPFFQQ